MMLILDIEESFFKLESWLQRQNPSSSTWQIIISIGTLISITNGRVVVTKSNLPGVRNVVQRSAAAEVI